MFKWAKALGVSAALLLAAAPFASAQTVSSQVFYVMDMMRADIAWREAGAPANQGNLYFSGTVSSLYDDEDRYDHVVQNWGGGLVTIAGFCSANCRDLDLFVMDQNNNVVASDTAVDPRPQVTFRPSQSGVYSVRALMYDCDGKCYFATAIYFRED